ncbi:MULTISPECIES: hypothetical protein [unclassified Lysinibacillus]
MSFTTTEYVRTITVSKSTLLSLGFVFKSTVTGVILANVSYYII